MMRLNNRTTYLSQRLTDHTDGIIGTGVYVRASVGELGLKD